ncbi:MAG: glycosyltransferase family 2 protein [Bacteroidetes bacterium]|nr:glycosyltransferase family 2 protein [Bacteroidota bacterium]
MKVTGFSFIRNAIKYDYPIKQAILSILPICDEFVIAVGKSEDGTLDLIKSINPKKIKIIETEWDDSLREGGRVLAEETNKAFQAIGNDADWCFYIQGDEIVHEKDHDAIRKAMLQYKDDKRVDGLLFKYIHFYGSYNHIGTSSRWYPHEIRIVRNDKSIYSYRDAQGFRKGDNQKLNVKAIDAYIYHYGWVKDAATMQSKQEIFHSLWHDDAWLEKNVGKKDKYDYYKDIDTLALYKGTHPKVIQETIRNSNLDFDYDINFNRMTLKEKFKAFARKYLGLDFSYKNYKLI